MCRKRRGAHGKDCPVILTMDQQNKKVKKKRRPSQPKIRRFGGGAEVVARTTDSGSTRCQRYPVTNPFRQCKEC